MAYVATRPDARKSLDRTGRSRPIWGPTRPTASPPTAAEEPAAEFGVRREGATVRTPRSDPPLKGQTGPRHSY